jgi:hypothetical protein
MTKGETVHMGKTGASEGNTFPFMIRVKRRTMARIEFARPSLLSRYVLILFPSMASLLSFRFVLFLPFPVSYFFSYFLW